MELPLFQVDAFTDKPFAGNPAAVCLLSGPADPSWMQRVAQEMNLSETAFLHPETDGYRLRWFTPAVEVALCGHATLASAHVLWEQGHMHPGTEARFHTQSGLLTARQDGPWIELNFPANTVEPAPAPAGLAEALGAELHFVGRSRFDYLVEVASEEVVRRLTPDVPRLAALPVRGVIVTAAAATPGFDFVSRFFAPAAGVAEDPVTGSAHCCLTPFWGARLHKTEMTAYQASPRGGVVGVRWAGDRVHLRGQAVTVLRGQLVA
jgi:PhzF family phenazine biosynthesis protein